MHELEPRQRLAAYGIAVARDRVLLARHSARSHLPGTWALPGGGVEIGEHPRACVARELREETGLDVEVGADPLVLSDILELPARRLLLHSVRLCYPVRVLGGALADEVDGTTDLVRWVPRAELAALPLMPFTREALG